LRRGLGVTVKSAFVVRGGVDLSRTAAPLHILIQPNVI
jgi:hypothetical protein